MTRELTHRRARETVRRFLQMLEVALTRALSNYSTPLSGFSRKASTGRM